jgi:hypothetical protein
VRLLAHIHGHLGCALLKKQGLFQGVLEGSLNDSQSFGYFHGQDLARGVVVKVQLYFPGNGFRFLLHVPQDASKEVPSQSSVRLLVFEPTHGIRIFGLWLSRELFFAGFAWMGFTPRDGRGYYWWGKLVESPSR